VFASAIAFVATPAIASQVPPGSVDELAAAPRIVLADLIDARSRWNAKGNLILTDYRFRTVEVLRGTFGETFVLTQGGGTVGAETHALSDLPVFSTGARYLLLLNEADNTVFSSVRYGPAGAIEVDRMGDSIVTAALGDGGLATFRQRVLETPVIPDAALIPQVQRTSPLPAKRFQHEPLNGPLLASEPADASWPGMPERGRHGADAIGGATPAPAAPGMLAGIVPNYVVQRRPAPFVTFNPLPLAWEWSPADQNMMADWNRYGDVFRVLTTPTGNWAWGNDRYDLAGFPSNADMLAQFGENWGATTLAICYSRWFGDGPIVESDIALNPAYAWTLDEQLGSTVSTSQPWSFRQTMQHELGHAWGLKHPWETTDVWWPSTMNYGPKWARTATLHSDDTAGIRWAYPGRTLHDGSLVAYGTADTTGNNNPTYTAARPSSTLYNHGNTLAFDGPVTLQNLGTTNLVDPVVELYLTERRMDWAGARLLGSSNYTLTVAPFPSSIVRLNLASVVLPSTLPTGRYFAALYLAASGGTDAATGNNSAWVRDSDTLTVRNVRVTLVPQLNEQLAPIGRIGPLGEWFFQFAAAANTTYVLSTCGNAAFDTVIELTAGSGAASNDDACGLQSNLRWTSPVAQTAAITVRGYNQAAQGEFRLAYRVEPDLLFAAGFEP
jgi:hypothetical protein